MILIHVSVQTLDHNIDQFENTIRVVQNQALQLDGCVKYEWYRTPDQLGKYAVYAEFDTRENFENYLQSHIVKRIGSDVVPLLVSPPTFKHFEADVFEES